MTLQSRLDALRRMVIPRVVEKLIELRLKPDWQNPKSRPGARLGRTDRQWIDAERNYRLACEAQSLEQFRDAILQTEKTGPLFETRQAFRCFADEAGRFRDRECESDLELLREILLEHHRRNQNIKSLVDQD